MRTLVAASGIFLIAAGIISSGVNAATFTIIGEVDSSVCLYEESTAGVSGSCAIANHNGTGSLTARSELGSLGIGGSFYASGTNPEGADLGVRALMQAVFLDVLTFGIQSGTFILPVDVGGTNSVQGTGLFGGIVGGGAGISSAVGVVVGDTTIYYENSIYDGSSGQYSTIDGIGTLGISEVMFQIVGGQVDLLAAFDGQFWCQGLLFGSTCSVASDFFTSARFLSATVLDEFGVVSAASITSQSGFDYRAGVEPHAVAPVPLPAAGWFLGTALLMIGGVASRRRKRHGEATGNRLAK
jgi:hypothetical protein